MEQHTQVSLETLGEDFHRAYEGALVHARKRLGQTHRLWINGKSLRSKLGTFQSVLPAHRDELVGKFQKANRDHVGKAIEAAKTASALWRELGWQQRISYLRKIAEVLQSHQYELAALLSLEVGKNRMDAFAEVSETLQTIHYYCQQTERHQGFTYRMNGTTAEHHQCALRPHGVWAVFTPFNFPLSLPVGTATAAMAGGNTIVFKPSSRAALMGTRLTALLHDSGLPVGVFNLVTGPGSELIKEFAANPRVDGFAFTGSPEVGVNLLRQFTGAYPRPCLAAMGGNNPVIVMPSARLEAAAEGILRSAFGVNGQHCGRCSRVYAHRKIRKPLVECLLEKTQAFKIGDPLARETVLGPLIDETALSVYKQAVALGKKQGRLRTGGKVLRSAEFAQGYYVQPAIIDQLPEQSRLHQIEYLAPVLVVTEVGSLTAAIDLANGAAFGQAAGIFTEVQEEQVYFFNHIDAASAYCNRREGATTGAWPGIQSVGGWKASGSSSRNALGPFYVPQFLREQSQSISA